MSILFFKKPAFVPPRRGPLSASEISGPPSAEACATAAIPPELSFENVICNKCPPPCSLQDFLDYLMYVSHDAENLQFYLWMVDYHQRFRNAPQVEKELSPRWRGGLPAKPIERGERAVDMDVAELDTHSVDISSATSEWESELSDNCIKTVDDYKVSASPIDRVPLPSRNKENVSQWQTAASKQPFRTEINRIMNHYLAAGAPRELNLSPKDRATVLSALRCTTHPSALNLVKIMLDTTLRKHAHPNFVRWSICNGNKHWTIGEFSSCYNKPHS